MPQTKIQKDNSHPSDCPCHNGTKNEMKNTLLLYTCLKLYSVYVCLSGNSKAKLRNNFLTTCQFDSSKHIVWFLYATFDLYYILEKHTNFVTLSFCWLLFGEETTKSHKIKSYLSLGPSSSTKAHHIQTSYWKAKDFQDEERHQIASLTLK